VARVVDLGPVQSWLDAGKQSRSRCVFEENENNEATLERDREEQGKAALLIY
jgi:hypothetical protein